MPVFAYEAIDGRGNKLRKAIEAANKQEALQKIRTMGLKPTKLQEKKGASAPEAGAAGGQKKKGISLFNRVSTADVTQFTQQMATLQDAGLPIVRSLKILSGQMKEGSRFRTQLETVTEDVEGGSTFSEALEKYPGTFDNLYVAMVKAGEAGGVLDVIMQRLSDFQEKSLKLKKKVKAAMIYPIAVISVACVILGFIMTKVIPQFQKMFEDMDSALPGPTQALLAVSDGVKAYWWAAPAVTAHRRRIQTWSLTGMLL